MTGAKYSIQSSTFSIQLFYNLTSGSQAMKVQHLHLNLLQASPSLSSIKFDRDHLKSKFEAVKSSWSLFRSWKDLYLRNKEGSSNCRSHI